MKVTATTLPRRSLRASRAPSCVVRLNAGAGPIFGRSALSPTAWLSDSASQLTTASVMSLLPCHLFHLFMLPPLPCQRLLPPLPSGERSLTPSPSNILKTPCELLLPLQLLL